MVIFSDREEAGRKLGEALGPRRGALILGIPRGGVIVALFGSPAAFLVNSISYVGLIGVLFRWKRPIEEKPFPPEPILAAMMAGLRYVSLSPTIRSVLMRALAALVLLASIRIAWSAVAP